MTDLQTQATQVAQQASQAVQGAVQGAAQQVAAFEAKAETVIDAKWGWVRKSLAARPLTTAWGFFLIGLGLGTIAGGQIASMAVTVAGVAVTHLP